MLAGPGLVKTAAQWRAAAIYGIGFFAVPFLTLPWMLQYLSSTTIAIYYASIPLFILLLSRIFLKTPISARKWVGFFIGSIGLVALATVGVDASAAVAKPDAVIPLLPHMPHIICVLTAVFLAGGGVYFQSLPRLSPLSMTASAFVAASVIAAPILMISTWWHMPVAMPSTLAIASIIGTGVVATGVGTLLRGILIRREGAIFTSINAYIVPVNVSILGVAFLGETVSMTNVAAFCLIVTGLLIARR